MTVVDTGADPDAGADTGTPDYADGQMYEVTMTVCTELPLNYTFRASDGTTDAHGEATNTQSLSD